MSKEAVVEAAWRTLKGAAPVLPRRDDLLVELADAEAAQARGYYLPDEDERLRETYRSYLMARASLWEMVRDLRPHWRGEDLRIFSLAFCAASMLVRAAGFVIALARERPVVWAKLDEAEPRYGLERKSFTHIFRNLSSSAWMGRYRISQTFYEKNRADIHKVLAEGGLSEMIPWLESEEPHFQVRKSSLWWAVVVYHRYSFLRRSGSGYAKVMFHLFRLSGSTIAGMKQPFVKKLGAGKRAHPGVLDTVRGLLKPGDVFVTRHDDALSNLFLPGYWPHAALYLGSADERKILGLPENGRSGGEIRVLEAKKDGVLFRELAETLAVDAFVVIRPKTDKAHLREALARAMTHEGKLYDFVFDFRTADRLVCTELVYRAYHGVGNFHFQLSHRSGRYCLSAEDLLSQGITGGHFEVVMCYGVEDNILRHGEAARRRLLASLRKFGAK